MAKRKSRKKISKKVDITKPLLPIDILEFGTDNDPCFGKHYDLTEDECKICGDCHLCSIVFNQKTENKRSKIEKENRFKDLELTNGVSFDKKEVNKFISKLLGKGIPRLKIIRKTMDKFSLEKSKVKELINKLK